MYIGCFNKKNWKQVFLEKELVTFNLPHFPKFFLKRTYVLPNIRS